MTLSMSTGTAVLVCGAEKPVKWWGPLGNAPIRDWCKAHNLEDISEVRDVTIGGGNTMPRSMRIPEPIWIGAVARAKREGTTVTAVVVEALRRYVAG